MKIRPIKSSDFESFYSCFGSIVDERVFFQFSKIPDSEKMKKFIEGLIKRNFTMMVSLDDSENVIGWIELIPLRGLESSHNLDLTIGVRKEHRKKGIAQDLLTKSLEIVDRIKYKFIRLEVIKSNFMAINFYKKNGFIEDGVIQKKYLIDNKYQDALLMSKEL